MTHRGAEIKLARCSVTHTRHILSPDTPVASSSPTPSQDKFWSFCTTRFEYVEISEDNINSEALSAAAAYITKLYATGVLFSWTEG